jgi:capsular polysaccharide biosynthesis protein
VGLLLGLVVATAGFALISRQEPQYAATASLLVLPDSKARPEIVASLYDSLSSGQVVESYRAVMVSPGFADREFDSLGLTPRDRDGVVLDVHVVPSTALIDATVTASSPEVAERVADGLARRATTELIRTFEPYRITSVSAAAGTAEKSGPSSRTLGGVVALLAIVAVVVGQQAVLFLVSSRERARARRRPQRDPGTRAGRVS